MPKAPSRGSLADLGGLRDALREQARERAQAEQRARAERERLARERDVFRAAVGDAAPLRPTGRIDPVPQPVPPIARQFERDESEALCLLTGGAAPCLAPHLSVPFQLMENLILDGLVRFGAST